MVPHRGTNWAAPWLTSQIGRDAVLSRSYGRGYLSLSSAGHKPHFLEQVRECSTTRIKHLILYHSVKERHESHAHKIITSVLWYYPSVIRVQEHKNEDGIKSVKYMHICICTRCMPEANKKFRS